MLPSELHSKRKTSYQGGIFNHNIYLGNGCLHRDFRSNVNQLLLQWLWILAYIDILLTYTRIPPGG